MFSLSDPWVSHDLLKRKSPVWILVQHAINQVLETILITFPTLSLKFPINLIFGVVEGVPLVGHHVEAHTQGKDINLPANVASLFMDFRGHII
jgi:hypothetical protein